MRKSHTFPGWLRILLVPLSPILLLPNPPTSQFTNGSLSPHSRATSLLKNLAPPLLPPISSQKDCQWQSLQFIPHAISSSLPLYYCGSSPITLQLRPVTESIKLLATLCELTLTDFSKLFPLHSLYGSPHFNYTYLGTTVEAQ